MSNRETKEMSMEDFEHIMEWGDGDESEIWENVEENDTYHDMEKGYKEVDLIVVRKSDKKFFKFKYYYSPHVGWDRMNTFPLIGEEVFAKQITTTVYE